LFSATPTQGEVPLSVQFNNQSVDATDYTWYIGADTINEASPSYVFTEPGESSASLIAYDTNPWCSDTSEVLKIITEYPFNIIIPSTYFSYTDSYQIYTSRVSQLDYTLFNSIGQQVYHKHFVPVTGYSPLWERKDVARGVYLYTIKATGEDGQVREFTGRVLVM